ncbi:MAG: methionyl-tRNA formyltransferase [Oscillospiraceae bacterium]|nr:methionyl-tRNA formyltransferase [Oscillospiraceae bacterium]
MKIVFMGTPDFAEISLRRLYDEGHDIAAVFTQPDKPKNRGKKLAMSPVKLLALERGTPVYQPDTLRDGQAEKLIKDLDPELIIAVAYGKLLPESILSIPPKGCINIHGSILPKYRGSAPIQWTVLNGDEEGGVTAMYMGKGMDTGDIIAFEKVTVGEKETAGELFDRLAVLGAELLCRTVSDISMGDVSAAPQNEADATYAPPLTKDMCPIDWSGTGRQIIKHICGLDPWPVATAEIGGATLKIFDADRTDRKTGKTPGTIVSAGNAGIEVACADGTVIIKELQAPGKKRMPAADYLRGHPLCL